MHEPFEIYHFGEKLYHAIEGELPYGIVKHFTPQGKEAKITNIHEPAIASLINQMITSTPNRPEVFSELLIQINQFQFYTRIKRLEPRAASVISNEISTNFCYNAADS